MKNKKMIRRFSLILAVLMLVPMFTFSGAALETRPTNSTELDTWYFEYDSEVYMGYEYTACAESYSSAKCKAPYSQGYMIFEADEEDAEEKTVTYTLGHRVDYILNSLRQYESITETVTLTPDMEVWWGCYDGQYVKIYYNLSEMELMQYIFASATTSDNQLRAARAYKDVDFIVYGY